MGVIDHVLMGTSREKHVAHAATKSVQVQVGTQGQVDTRNKRACRERAVLGWAMNQPSDSTNDSSAYMPAGLPVHQAQAPP